MFFRFCYSSMCGAIFLFWHFSPALQILWHFSALVSHFRGHGALMEIESLPHTPWWQWQSRQWWQTSHLTIIPNFCTSLYFQLYQKRSKVSNCPRCQIVLGSLFSYRIFFSPQKVLTFTFFINIQNKGHACLVCGVKRRMCDALLPACLAQSNLPQTSNIIIYGTCIFPTLEFQ